MSSCLHGRREKLIINQTLITQPERFERIRGRHDTATGSSDQLLSILSVVLDVGPEQTGLQNRDIYSLLNDHVAIFG